MQRYLFADDEVVEFLSDQGFFYGERITILDKPQKNGSGWVVSSMLRSGDRIDLILQHNLELPANMIVLRNKENGHGLYLHQAVPVSQLEKKIKTIEADFQSPI